jgi:competence protein ComEC
VQNHRQFGWGEASTSAIGGRTMSDLAAVALALATASGAWAAKPVPLWIGVVVAAAAFALRRPVLLWIACGLLASALSAAAWAGLRPPADAPVDAVVTLLRDPQDLGGAQRAIARLGHRHVEISARGGAGRVLAERLAGERVRVVGRLGPVAPVVRNQLARQHVAAEVVATDVRWEGDGDLASRMANQLRRTLVRGAASMSHDQRTLFTGFVLGDDRGQSVDTIDDFRAAGLTHLLAVSGENVAFVLALAGPFLRRLPLGWRLVAGLAVLGLFGVLTRWEPSVMRAEAMAALALAAAAAGRPASSLRLLALAVTGLLLLDPLLVGSVGFLLSVGACTGIALLAAPLTRWLPGPRPIAAAAGVTLAAQAGVAPVLLPVFGALPVATLPANLLAMPAAGPVMMWGVVAGIPAGLLGGRAAAALHLPTRVLVGWIALVARMATRAPLGTLGLVPLCVLAAVIAAGAAIRRLRVVSVAGAIAVLLFPAVALAASGGTAAFGTEIVPGARLWHDGATAILVVDTPRPDRVLVALRNAGVARIDVLVARRAGARSADAIEPIIGRVPAGLLLVPPGYRSAVGAGAVVPQSGAVVRTGPFTVIVLRDGDRLDATVERAPP